MCYHLRDVSPDSDPTPPPIRVLLGGVERADHNYVRMTETQDVAAVLEERRKLIRRAGGQPTTWRIILGPYTEEGRRVRDVGELRKWPWATLILILHGVDSFLLGLHPNGFYFGVGIVDGRYSPGPHLSRREGWAYLRFEREEDLLPVIRSVARIDPLAQLRIAKEDSFPFARCPNCSAEMFYPNRHSVQCCDSEWEFEGRAFGTGTWKRIG